MVQYLTTKKASFFQKLALEETMEAFLAMNEGGPDEEQVHHKHRHKAVSDTDTEQDRVQAATSTDNPGIRPAY
ncbi:hypothetical protein [Endozoicomonas euniceicola]|uniref:Uncharacterized protein n=1 Tax=Endozoicomonas euniceicola TaxID=1234143 RepID=A0ABY6GPA6_9GAMM|nr:hypothetical protein [Endozoicomonas euniceicola]UYM14562.1 hypothetical protein NX720_16910 [Endozoicomonas euniceicola]